jgi:hypothetical protein
MPVETGPTTTLQGTAIDATLFPGPSVALQGTPLAQSIYTGPSTALSGTPIAPVVGSVSHPTVVVGAWSNRRYYFDRRGRRYAR